MSHYPQTFSPLGQLKFINKKLPSFASTFWEKRLSFSHRNIEHERGGTLWL
jgi:hypothetical protein